MANFSGAAYESHGDSTEWLVRSVNICTTLQCGLVSAKSGVSPPGCKGSVVTYEARISFDCNSLKR